MVRSKPEATNLDTIINKMMLTSGFTSGHDIKVADFLKFLEAHGIVMEHVRIASAG